MGQQIKNILVIGANGKTGSRIYRQLKEKGLSVKGASRNGEIHFDWQAPETWSAALLQIDAVYLTYYPDLAIPEAPEDISKFCALAKIKGVQHITLLSGRGEPAAQVCEEIVQNSGLSHTVIRASWFNQNFSEGMFREFINAGTIALPVGSVGEPFIDIDDISEVAVASLTDSRHNGQLYEVTGPELLSFAQLADIFSKYLPKPINFIQVSQKSFVSSLEKNSVDPSAIAMLNYLFTEVLDGRNEFLGNGIEKALGRPAKSFDRFVQDNLELFSGVENV
ncbi:NmrA family NAD(P)-binding protein [Paraglaciecola sp.]|uniref:SDR family oxidoreductase n=1 Tax=Paraglaciecola sp. TaxID=1920173 RepID=UPI003267743A